jgi:hypothetical protein
MQDREVAFALLAFGEARPVRWIDAVDDKGGSGYPVDSGTGRFADAATAARLAARERSGDLDLFDAIERAGLFTQGWANLCVDPASGANLIAFPSGAGDGTYHSYWGLDERGAVVALVTDFGLTTDSERRTGWFRCCPRRSRRG